MNSLKLELEGKYVVLSKKYYKGDNSVERVFLCEAGFGCSSFTMGTAIGGTFVFDGDNTRVEGYQIHRLATDKEVEEAKKKLEERCSSGEGI